VDVVIHPASKSTLALHSKLFGKFQLPAQIPMEKPAEKQTVTKSLQGFYGLSTDNLTALQQSLYEGGFYSDAYYAAHPKQPAFGSTDDDSYAAFKRAVLQAAKSQKPLYTDVIAGAAAAKIGESKMAASAPRQDGTRTVRGSDAQPRGIALHG
jgi:hypothetical protein